MDRKIDRQGLAVLALGWMVALITTMF